MIMTALQLVDESNRKTIFATTGDNTWGERHVDAMTCPKHGFERGIALMLAGFAEYADAYRAGHEGEPVGQDGFLGDHWEDIGIGILGLLNGETGRIDCGTIDGLIRKIGALNGARSEEYETSEVSPAQRRAAIPDACSCPEDSCACKRMTCDGQVCPVCERGKHAHG
jgi:hypothetical protein